MTAIEIITEFVEGAISPKAFEEMIYSDPGVKALLEVEGNLPAYINEPDLYSYVIAQDYLNLECIYNVQTLLSAVLSKKGIVHTVEKKYENLFSLTLKVQPKWLSLPAEYFLKLVEEQKNLSPKELQSWLKNKIKTDFRCLKATPKWLQGPDWPVVDGRPTVFLGQLDISELSHDCAQAYLFFDEEKKIFHTISQAC